MEKSNKENWCEPHKCASLLINTMELRGRLNMYRHLQKINCLTGKGKYEYYAESRSRLFDWKDAKCEKIMGSRLANQLLKIGIKRMGQFEIFTKEQLIEKGIKKSSTNRMWMHTDKMKIRLGV
jgi:hypothetical protein